MFIVFKKISKNSKGHVGNNDAIIPGIKDCYYLNSAYLSPLGRGSGLVPLGKKHRDRCL